MKEIVNLALRTEYSLKNTHTFGRLAEIVKHDNGTGTIGICDSNGSYGFVQFEKICKTKNLKPIFGTRLMVVDDSMVRDRAAFGPEYIFIAKNSDGYEEINRLIKTAFERFYYKAFVLISDVLSISDNVFVIAENFLTPERIDYIALTTTTPRMMLDWDIPKVAINNNFYPTAEDKEKYEVLCGARKHGQGFRFLFNDQTYPMHILTTPEWYRMWGDESAIDNTHKIASECDVSIPSASMVKYPFKGNINDICAKGAKKKGIDIKDGVYAERLEKELDVIEKKGFTDYFMIVSDMIAFAKRSMLVGPSRGSCAGSLVCYLMDITSIDPIEQGLFFERFIDINRNDMPDIDIDFPDNKRQDVIKYLVRRYGADNVCHIANINKLKARSAIHETAMALSIPFSESEAVKDVIVDRTGGDARAAIAARDTLESTEIGKQFLEKYPKMGITFDLEGHATHAGKHAGGIIVCNDKITKFCGVNSKEDMIMMDKKDAELKNLLKIDVLGLRTLTILEEAAGLAGFDFREFYSIPLDLKRAFKPLNEMRLSGIFQFEGQAMQMLCREVQIDAFQDIVALTALARPGPLHSGAANIFVRRKSGDEKLEYVSNNPIYVEATRETQVVIVYQEQLMNICRNLGNMTWNEVQDIRRAASKTMGKEFFDKYRESFLKGTRENGVDDKEAIEIWENMLTFGSWGMNKSHAVAYGYISYWCAFMKEYYPLEFAAATMRHTKNESSALKVLRDIYENDGINYIPVDPDESEVDWTIKDGKLLGGLINITGLAEKGAKEIISARKAGRPLTNSQYKKLISASTPYDILYPTEYWWGDYYDNPQNYGLADAVMRIKDIQPEQGTYLILGKIIQKDLRDLNEYNEIMKRGGQVLESNSRFLRLMIEDDTGQILCKINRFDFDAMNGFTLNDTLIVDKTWVIIKGEIKQNGWRILDIHAIADLEKIDYYGRNILSEYKKKKDQIVINSRIGL